MKYLVEIDDSSKAGTDAINYLRRLKVSGKSVFIRKFSRNSFVPLSPEELALPIGRKPTKLELAEFLDRKQGKGMEIEVARKKILDKPRAGRK